MPGLGSAKNVDCFDANVFTDDMTIEQKLIYVREYLLCTREWINENHRDLRRVEKVVKALEQEIKK